VTQDQNKPNKILQSIQDKFSTAVAKVETVAGETIVTLNKDFAPQFFTLCRFLHDDPDISLDYLSFVTAVDYLNYLPAPEHGCRYELVYQLFSLKWEHHLRLKLPLYEQEGGLQAKSVTPIWKSAELHENETFDMFGVSFEGHPDLRRMYMPEDWQGHPLRKDYPLKGERSRGEG
jgi:NADH-quinone oxidoreductase subunit C